MADTILSVLVTSRTSDTVVYQNDKIDPEAWAAIKDKHFPNDKFAIVAYRRMNPAVKRG